MLKTRPMLGSPDAYRPMGVAPTRAPRSQTVVPGRGGPHQVIETPGGWAPAIPPYITYPVQNLAWGNYDEPPFAPAKFTPSGQAMLSPAPPPRSPMPVPQPPAATTNGPLPIQDWFNLLKQ